MQDVFLGRHMSKPGEIGIPSSCGLSAALGFLGLEIKLEVRTIFQGDVFIDFGLAAKYHARRQ
jgi:hypothetical protein